MNSKDEHQDSLFPMREEMLRRTTRIEETRKDTTPTQSIGGHCSIDTQQKVDDSYIEEQKSKQKDEENERRSCHQRNQEYEENERKRLEWQERRKDKQPNSITSPSYFTKALDTYKSVEKRKQDSRAAFNLKYSARNREIGAQLREQRMRREEENFQSSTSSGKNQKRKSDQRSPSASPVKQALDQSPSKPPLRQKRREEIATSPDSNQDSFADANEEEELEESLWNVSICDPNVYQILNGDLVQHLCTTGLKYTNPMQKQFLQEFVCKKLNINEEQLSSL